MPITKQQYRQALIDRKRNIRTWLREEIHNGKEYDFHKSPEFKVLRKIDELIEAEIELATVSEL